MIFHPILRKSLLLLATPLFGFATGFSLVSCEDNVSSVGSDLATGEVQIALDSLIWNGTDQYIYRGNQKFQVNCPKISYTSYFDDVIDSRSTTNLLGRISVPEYGDLKCSFVSQLMCTARLDIPDSIPLTQIDSMKLLLRVPSGELTGDPYAPQQLKVFQLSKSLPNDIDNRFDPTGYYDNSTLLGTKSFTLSALGMKDSLYKVNSLINIDIPMSHEMAVKTVKDYRDEQTKSIFEWPQTFEQYFHGIYVDTSFGRGCVANIKYADFVIYYNYKEPTTTTSDGVTTTIINTKVGATGVFASSPIVLSSNNISYKSSSILDNLAANNEAIITTPGGYRVRLKFPANELLDIYNQSQSKLAVVSDLSFSIPVEEIENDYDITPPPYLILVKSSKLADFMSSNSLPDNKDSFYAQYSSKLKRYTFSSMRNYIIGLIQNGVTEDDLDFTIVPANIEFEEEQSSNYYYPYDYGYSTSSSSGVKYPTKCTPYISKPSMCRLLMDQARTIFTYSLQQMK